MPILNLSVSAQADAKLSASISESLTEATRVHLGKDPGVTAVMIHYISPTDRLIGGKSLAELGQTSFSLDVKVTAATNTKAQVAGYIDAVFQQMERLLGAVHQSSYIVVDEVAAAAWGFGGKTQEFRFIEAKIKDAA